MCICHVAALLFLKYIYFSRPLYLSAVFVLTIKQLVLFVHVDLLGQDFLWSGQEEVM